MQLTQLLVPPTDLLEREPHLLGCGMLRVLLAVLAFDEGRCKKGCNFEHVTSAREMHEVVGPSGEDSRENASLSKWCVRDIRG